MTGNDVLVFIGPVVLAALGIVTPFVVMKLRLRDARTRIMLDLDLIERLPSNWDGRAALVDSVNTRLRVLAVVSIPNGFRPDYYRAKTRRLSIFMFVGGTVVALLAYFAGFMIESPVGLAAYAVVVFTGAAIAFTGRSWLDEVNIKIRDGLPAGRPDPGADASRPD
ncbi:hypothetical protein E5720_03990 [Rhodococcus sp. PAMC28707]|uniref:hypothetical protein n=1 Tax=unclassified Rhodococcus (in: high G+C Gram-positive bacteria) TaxID=192944 RepID=UPI00109DDA75|nr:MULTISPECIES: hypothetical protein [unclassified Rhodococcus (in: high G+C Gram-positive bacteria)]QCB50535.1 hypothetical protein E5769_10025 [Rhodococcus sp. PAMC28705]QCB57773.1 hypothetical protein E5720_03990 [Rhodococcus sp. PAMC28707]